MNNLKKLRIKNNLTQKEVADLLSISPQGYSLYEKELRYPDPINLIRLADFYKVSIDYLLNRTQNNPQTNNTNLSNEALQIAILYDLCNEAGKARFQGCRDAVLGYMDSEQQEEFHKILKIHS